MATIIGTQVYTSFVFLYFGFPFFLILADEVRLVSRLRLRNRTTLYNYDLIIPSHANVPRFNAIPFSCFFCCVSIMMVESVYAFGLTIVRAGG